MALGMLGKYERLDVLGRGVSGIVYLAKDTLLNKQVALKEVDVQAGDVRRFLEEARVMDRLRHPNIVRVNGVDRIDDKVVIDMEYVRGSNLQEVLRAEGPFTIQRTLDISVQILDALQYAHSMQTVHRDIKPANILVDRDGVVKLADFGLAEILTTNAYAGGAGTYAYMAPEDFAEENHSDSQSDIWAVGVTMFEMLTGQRPFTVSNAKSPFAWKRALETEEARRVSDILPEAPPMLDAILARALARDKSRRYATAGEFLNDLKTLRGKGEEYTATARLVDLEPLANSDRTVNATWDFDPEDNTDWAPRLTRSRDAFSTMPQLPGSAPVAVKDVAPATSAPMPAAPQQALPRTPRRGILGFRGRNVEAQISVSPEQLELGTIRLGDLKRSKLNIKATNLSGPCSAEVAPLPDWLSVSPSQFDTARQTVTVTADADRVDAPGLYQETIVIDSAAGSLQIPVSLNVIPARPRFRQVAFWYIPLFAISLAPAMVSAMADSRHAALVPPAAAASLALQIMLLIISVAADLGIGERLASGMMAASMCFVLGLQTATANRIGYNTSLGHGVETAAVAGFAMGLLLLVQILTARRWKFWAVILAVSGLLLGGICYEVATTFTAL